MRYFPRLTLRHASNIRGHLKIADVIKSNEVLSPTHFAHALEKGYHGNNVLKIADVIKSNDADVIKSNEVLSPTHFAHASKKGTMATMF